MEYFDLQVNGAFGVDFNDDLLTLVQFEFACRQLAETGVVGFFPTLITDSIEKMCRRIKSIAGFVAAIPALQKWVRGIHVEGPFLSSQPGFYGTHPLHHIQPANIESALQLLDAGGGLVRMLTLAPEQDPNGDVIRRLRRENVVVFAGHTDASYETLQHSIDNGLVGFTHLGNGCVHQVNRHDNIAQRVLALKSQLIVTLIADGVHLPNWLLKSWLEIIGDNRSIIISDSMSAAGMPPGEYMIGGQPIQVDETRRTTHRDHGYLAGSASTMADMEGLLDGVLRLNETVRMKIMHSNAMSLFNS